MLHALTEMLRGLWRRLPMRLRRAVGQRLLRTAQPWLAASLPKAGAQEGQAPREASVLGVFHAALGHGTAARLLVEELNAHGVGAQAMDVTRSVGADYNDPRPLTETDHAGQGPLILAINPDTALVTLAGRASLLRGRPVIGYFVWELEEAPPAWRKLRHAVDALWSPSRFSAAALERTFGTPAMVIPHPVALAPPPAPTPAARARGLARIGAREGDFVALSSFSVTSSLARKNPFGAIAAFQSAFGASPQHRLVLRCLGGHRFPEALESLRAAVRDAEANITLLDNPAGVEELHDLYAACDVVLALHRSEGFGLNLAEAMLSRRAVIATGWSGNLDFMDSASAALVDYRLAPVQDPQRIYRSRTARWAEPDHDQAVDYLRRLAQDETYRASLAEAGAAMAKARLSGGQAAHALERWMATA